MKPATHSTTLRVAALLREAGVPGAVVEFEQSTKTSADAAAAIGCTVAEIAKTIVFRREGSAAAVLVVASGDHRVSESKVKALVGGPIERADAEFVRAATGYAIGGVCPVGLPSELTVLLDTDLQRFARLWAAGGTPNSVFPLTPMELQRLTSAGWADVKQDLKPAASAAARP